MPIPEQLITKTIASRTLLNTHFQNQGGIKVIKICMMKSSIIATHKMQFKIKNKNIRKSESN
jgi:hypothetical protein